MWVTGEPDLRVAKGPKKTAGKADQPFLEPILDPALYHFYCVLLVAASHRARPDSVWENPGVAWTSVTLTSFKK